MRRTGNPSVGTWWSDLGAGLCVALATVLCMLAIPGNAMAATIVVNSLADTVVSGDGVCTLREAVANAEGDNRSSTDCAAGHGADTITFSLSGTINLDVGLDTLAIASAGGLTIDGGRRITISGSGEAVFSPVIGVAPAGVLTLKNLTVADIRSRNAISNGGTMTISECTVRDNEGLYSVIGNGGTMTISSSTIRGNSNTGLEGQGIISNGGTMTISTSTINGNGVSPCLCSVCDCSGGVISNGPEGILTISNSTVSGTLDPNFPDIFSGIYNLGTMTISTSTVSDNKGASNPPRGIFNSGTLKLQSSLIADDCVGPITSLGYNLDKTGTCGLTGPGDQSNIDPRLDPAGLKDNGGPTKTYALCTGPGTPAGCTGKSPAIDAIPTANCTGAGGNPLGIDQRDFFRPADGGRNGTALCDIGAFEATSSPLATLNSLVTFTPLPATFRTSRETTGCPAGSVGRFQFTADLTNKAGSPPVKHVVAEVATLTKGNLLLNADGGLGGDGATVTFGPSGDYADGLLNAKEHVTLPFTLCLKTFDPFTFFVDVLGTR